MRMALCACVALLSWGLTGASADAFYGFPWPPVGYWTYQPQVITCYRTQWTEEKVPIVVQRVSYKQEAYKVKIQVPVPQFYDQKVRTSFYVPVPKVIERDVTTWVMVPVPVFDPCSCCCYFTYRPSFTTTKVKCVVYDQKLESREDVVKVCKMVLEDRLIDQVRMIPVVTPVKSFTVRHNCVVVPYQTTINVPVWVPCCPAPCCQ